MTRIICVASVVYFKIRFFLKYTIMKTATFLLQQVLYLLYKYI
ncbi:hypothetical protein [Wolbachia pipientis]|nr:hypothetical protein [Wolbachia pipientis]